MAGYTTTIVIALAVVGTLTAGFLFFGGKPTPSVDAVKDVYNQWKLTYKINVGAAEDEHRFGIFAENYGKINAHNALNKSWTLGLNQFTHLTQTEFSTIYLGFKASTGPRNTVKLPTKNLKATVDWTGKMNGVKDQGQCGSCWAFSAVGAIEGAHSVGKGNLYNLAEQDLVDCSTSYGNNGCGGGLMDYAFKYAIDQGGLSSQKDYPYTAADGQCKTGLTKSGAISSFVDVTPNDPAALKAAISKGPVAVAIEADTYTFQGYTGGVINDASCGTQLDHGVVAVGYNEDDKTPYYKVRNSWGAIWGEAGHVRIGIQGGAGICGIQSMASYPTL